ncbi:hypothetical protein B0H10DRAFT_1954642 [Mycena sp. CBHHK59/15]|nr:hypothetical protein B0H10DRAFT_1954642 [Mycena sp. CBHHK59/15]
MFPAHKRGRYGSARSYWMGCISSSTVGACSMGRLDNLQSSCSHNPSRTKGLQMTILQMRFEAAIVVRVLSAFGHESRVNIEMHRILRLGNDERSTVGSVVCAHEPVQGFPTEGPPHWCVVRSPGDVRYRRGNAWVSQGPPAHASLMRSDSSWMGEEHRGGRKKTGSLEEKGGRVRKTAAKFHVEHGGEAQ